MLDIDKSPKNSGGIVKFATLYAIVFGVIVFIIPIFLSQLWSTQELSQYSVYVSTFTQIFLIGGISVFAIKKYNFDTTEMKKFNLHLNLVLNLICISLIVFVLIRLLSDGVKWIYVGLTDDFSIIELPVGMSAMVFLSAVLFLAMIPAFCEELFYRFVGYNLLKNNRKLIILLILGISFAFAHIAAGLDSVINAFILGMVLSLLYIREHSYYSVVLIHAFYNIFSLFFTYKIYWPTDGAYISVRASSGAECIFWGMIYIAIAVILSPIIILILSGFNKKVQ